MNNLKENGLSEFPGLSGRHTYGTQEFLFGLIASGIHRECSAYGYELEHKVGEVLAGGPVYRGYGTATTAKSRQWEAEQTAAAASRFGYSLAEAIAWYRDFLRIARGLGDTGKGAQELTEGGKGRRTLARLLVAWRLARQTWRAAQTAYQSASAAVAGEALRARRDAARRGAQTRRERERARAERAAARKSQRLLSESAVVTQAADLG